MEQKPAIPESPAETLARSAFGFALLALIPAVITWIAFLLAPVASESAFGQMRTLIIVVFGIVTLLLLALCAWTFRSPPEKLLKASQRITAVSGKAWLAVPFMLVLLEINLFAALALYSVAPAFVEPSRFLLACWSLLLLIVMLTTHRYALAAWLEHTRTVWTVTGLAVVLVIICAGMYFFTYRLIRSTALDDRIRGGLDAGTLPFIDDGSVPTTGQFMAEQAQRRVEWLPYSYWTVEEIHGQYINVGADGLRQTPNDAPETAGKIFFFGGSTMWGEGARDAYTIPGHTARLLKDAGTPQFVVNYGQTGYVSTQDMLLFQMQLLQGNAPDIAVFYEGFNDILSASTQNLTGIPLQEAQRVSDVEAGRLLRGGQPVLRLPDGRLNMNNIALVAQSNSSAAGIVSRWLANVKMMQTLADAYGVRAVFIWQPAIIFKQSLTESEQIVVKQMEVNYPGMTDLYRQADALVRQQIQDQHLANIVLLSDLFKDDARPIFYDLVHITEAGNLVVAQTLLPLLENNLSPG